MFLLENFLHELSQALQHGATHAQIEEWGKSPLLKEHELVQATYAVLAKRAGLNASLPPLETLPGGGIPLYKQGFFPWHSLPYPKEHAELGICLCELGDLETARNMARYQEATLDHNQKPAYALFTQEGFCYQKALDQANAAFFEATGYPISDELQFSDTELGMISWRRGASTVMCSGSGCKSGMGLFLNHDAGIINWGPQTSPIGKSEGFGLAGRAQKRGLHSDKRGFSLSFQCRLSTPLARVAGFSHLSDAGYSGIWLDAAIEGTYEEMACRMRFDGPRIEKIPLLVLFGKGNTCLVAKSHQLKPRSLNRYSGPSQPVQLIGSLGQVSILAEGMESMEIIPLAGDGSFWGADFMVVYTLSEPGAYIRLHA